MKWALFRVKGSWHLQLSSYEKPWKTRCGVNFVLPPEKTQDERPQGHLVCNRCLAYSRGLSMRRRDVEPT